MPTYLDYSYDDRNGPAYPGLDGTDYAAQALAELQAQRNAQAADLGRQDAMINIARGNVPNPAGVVYSNDLGRSGAYRGYAINERYPWANMTARWVTDPSSGQVMFQHLVGANSAQPHFVPGQALPTGALSAPLLNTMLYALSTAPVTPVVRTRGGGAGGGGGVGGSGGAKAPTQNNGVIVPQKDPYPPMDMDTMGLFNNNAPASATPPVTPSIPAERSTVPTGQRVTWHSLKDEDRIPPVQPQVSGKLDMNNVMKLSPGEQWLRDNWNRLSKFEQEGLKNGTLDPAAVMNSYYEGAQTPVVVDTTTPYNGYMG